ncbi:MAG: acyl carrier protein [Fuerstiella sp.]
MSNRNEDTEQRVLKFVHEDLMNLDGPLQLTATDDLLTAGYIDSLGVMRLVAYLEQSFDITISTDAVTVENFTTARTIAALLADLSARPADQGGTNQS